MKKAERIALKRRRRAQNRERRVTNQTLRVFHRLTGPTEFVYFGGKWRLQN